MKEFNSRLFRSCSDVTDMFLKGKITEAAILQSISLNQHVVGLKTQLNSVKQLSLSISLNRLSACSRLKYANEIKLRYMSRIYDEIYLMIFES